MWPVDGIFILPGFMTWLYFDTVSARMGVGTLAFAVAGPNERDPTLSTDSFRRLLKTRLFSEYMHYSALEVLHFVHYINILTYLLLLIYLFPRHFSANILHRQNI